MDISATTISLQEIVIRLGLAVAFGMVLGLDRELRNKPAGLRTHMLVALGAAATTLVTFELFFNLLRLGEGERADPIRVIEGVISAIGFLGAGAIIQSRGNVHGMTTAANIWLVGAIGIACGGGYYTVAAITFVFTVVILTVLRLVERLFHHDTDR